MADYWKSNPRHYCEACKCWMGDNKVSIEFHEGGRRHKANVERLLRESRKRATSRDKEAAKLSETLEQIEKAALASYARDQKGLPPAKRVAMATTGITQTPDMIQFEQQNIKKQMAEKLSQKKKELDEQQTLAWQQLTSPEGYTYYYNSITGISQWEPPQDIVIPDTVSSAHPTSDIQYQEPDQHNNGQSVVKHENETIVKHENETIVKRENETIVKCENVATVKQENETEVKHENESQTYTETPITVSIKQEVSTDNQLITAGAGASYGAWTTVSVRAQSPTTPTDDEEDDNVDYVSDNEEHTLKEKTLPVLQDTSVKLEPGAFKGFAFKKKQKRSNNIKERTSDW